jgi:flagellin-like protein
MHSHRRWRRAPRRGVAEVLGAILLVALTVTAGVILWSFRIYTPSEPPTVSFQIRTGGSNPVWGDPTDCQPWGYSLSQYPLSGGALNRWAGNWWDSASSGSWWGECENSVTGNFSTLNTTQIIISAHTPADIPLSSIDFTFVCNNASSNGGTTILVNGSLASMTWFPGLSSSPAPNAPLLGSCGTFNAGGYGGGAFGTYYNRLALFVPLNQNISILENGDTFILYIHNGGWPLDFECVANAAGVFFSGETPGNGCQHTSHGNAIAIPQNDYDDYHGAPPWCFTTPGACTIYLTYAGSPSALLATIPVYSLAPPTSQS